uniref:Integrase catalytic domain-containing protein n=1 Tax=Stegastes partitus TaxID=144197 RepID=A0A3B5AY39_9TELE
VAHLNIASANTVIAALKDVFSRHGIPETVVSDNGPQYSCELFKDFATEYRFTHITSSPRYRQANDEAEHAVATIKGLWKGGGEKLKALMTYRATPLESWFSPAQLLMGRQLGFRKSEKRAKENQQHKYNLRYRARLLPPLQSGQNVWLPREEKQGTVILQATTPRSYIIHTDEGQLRRNCAHMRTLHQPQPQTTPEIPVATSEPGNTETHTRVTRETNIQKYTDTTNTPYVTTSGRVLRPPHRLNL